MTHVNPYEPVGEMTFTIDGEKFTSERGWGWFGTNKSGQVGGGDERTSVFFEFNEFEGDATEINGDFKRWDRKISAFCNDSGLLWSLVSGKYKGVIDVESRRVKMSFEFLAELEGKASTECRQIEAELDYTYPPYEQDLRRIHKN